MATNNPPPPKPNEEVIAEIGKLHAGAKIDPRGFAKKLVEYISQKYPDNTAPGITPCPDGSPCKQIESSEVKPLTDQDGKMTEKFKAAAKAHGMLPSHAFALQQRAAREHFTVTFRETSQYCPQWIELGFPMKPHDILEKSLSEKTLCAPGVKADGTKFGTKNGAALAGPLKEFLGLVGAYHPPAPPGAISDSEIIGLRTLKPDGTPGVIDLKLLENKDGNIFTKEFLEKYGKPITGDYDTLDFIDNDGNRVIAESPQQKSVCRNLNQAVRGDSKGDDPMTNVVQHGPQAAYLDFMMWENKPEPMMAPQLAPELPVLAFTNDGKCFYFKDEKALAAFYKCKASHPLEPHKDLPASWDLTASQRKNLTEQWNIWWERLPKSEKTTPGTKSESH
jgi:hypothetical protein